MNIKFGDQILNVRQIKTDCRRFKINDVIEGPNGILMRIETVQNNCPVWEHNRRTKVAVVLRNENDEQICLPEFPEGVYEIFRPRAAS